MAWLHAGDRPVTPDLSDSRDAEEILASARFVAAVVYVSLLVPYAWATGAAGLFLAAYLVYAGTLYFVARRHVAMPLTLQSAVHIVDLVVPIALAWSTMQLDHTFRRPFAATALYFVPLVHAAIRWGPGLTLATMVGGLAAAIGQISRVSAESLAAVDVAAGVLIGGTVLAFVGLLEQRRVAERGFAARLREQCEAAHGFKSAQSIALARLTAAFQARAARVEARSSAGRVVEWQYTAAGRSLRCSEIPGGGVSSDAEDQPPPRLEARFSTADWSGVVQILEPAVEYRNPRAVHLLERAVAEASSAVYNAYLRSSARSRAAKDERARLSRELHDGPIQALIGAEMNLEALRRRADLDRNAGTLDTGLLEVQTILRQEILSLRELMVRMKPLEMPPGGLPAYLARAVRRFSQESGIRGEFVAEDRSATGMPRQTAAALARIAHEALANVRKHSGATRVVVSLLVEGDGARLVVDDNGRGFDPQHRHGAPETINETVHQLGGDLAIDSTPGRGARLEVRIPLASPRTAAIAQRAAS